MGSSRLLWAVLVVLLVAVLVVYGYGYLFPPATRNPERLAVAAIESGTVKEQQYAAVKLVEVGKPARQQIVRVLEESKEPEVRVACVRGLTTLWDYRSMPQLLDLLSDPSASVRLAAGDAVEYMLRKDYLFREVNGDHQQAERQALIARMRSDWEEFKKLPLNRAFIREKIGGDLE